MSNIFSRIPTCRRFTCLSGKCYFIIFSLCWTFAAVLSFSWNLYQEREEKEDVARSMARIIIEKDIIYRRWNAGHGGVYVPTSAATQSNPHLSGIPERDITTPSGRQLTLMNPAYMTRQVHELERKELGIIGHIIGLKPIRSENAPDPWEKEALLAFTRGEKEYSSFELVNGEQTLRLMRPLGAELPCLRCHGKQGFKEGDVYGGISVSVPMKSVVALEARPLPVIVAGHVAIWLLGLAGIYLGWRSMQRSEAVRVGAEEARLRSDRLAAIVLDSTNDAIAVINVSDYVITGVNSVFLRRYGIDEQEALGKPCYAVTHYTDQSCSVSGHACPLLDTASGKGQSVVEHLHLNKDGTKRFEEVATYPIFDDAGTLAQVLHVSRDITERKLAEERIVESEARYRIIFESSGTAIIIIENDTTISMVNHEFEKLSGYTKEEVEGKLKWTELVPEEYLPMMLEYHRLRRVDPVAAPGSYEIRLYDRNRNFKVLLTTMELIPGTDRTVCSLLDMTEQKLAEEALRQSEATLGLAQRIAHLGNWNWNVETGEFVWSEEMYRIFGVDQQAFVPDYDRIVQMVHPDDREGFNRSINEALYAQKAFETDFRIILPNGMERMLYGQAEVVFDGTGKPLRMVGTSQDISWRIDADRALRNSEEKFSKAFHASPDWIVISRASDGRYVEVNEAFLNLTGYSLEEVIGRSSVELGIWNDPQDRIAMLKLLDENRQVRNLEVKFRMKSGEVRTMLWSADVIEFGGEACLIAAARDMTDQRNLERELVDSQAQLLIKHKELGNLFRQMEAIRREWEQTLDCINDMFILADHEGNIKRFNLALETFTGLPHRDIVNRNWQEFLIEQGLQANIDAPGVAFDHQASGKKLVLNSYNFADTEGGGLPRTVIMIHDNS